MLQNTNKKSLAEGVTKSQKWTDSEAKEALQSGKDAESQRKKSLTDEDLKMPRKSRTKRRKQHCKWQHTTRGCDTNKWQLTAVKQVAFLTVNHRGPLPLRELHSTGETIVWRDPGGSWACLQPVYDWEWSHSATGCDTDRQVAYIFVKQVVFLTVNHRGPLPLKELHSTGETLVWRDPGGSWACSRPVYDYEWNPPATVCDTYWGTLRRKEPRHHQQILKSAKAQTITAAYKKA